MSNWKLREYSSWIPWQLVDIASFYVKICKLSKMKFICGVGNSKQTELIPFSSFKESSLSLT